MRTRVCSELRHLDGPGARHGCVRQFRRRRRRRRPSGNTTGHDRGRGRPHEERPGAGAGRDRQRDRCRGHRVEDQPAEREVRRARRRHERVLRHGQLEGRHLRPQAEDLERRDDIIGLQNQEQVQASLAEDNAFATFIATLQFGGADSTRAAGQPTFIWNINPEMAGPRQHLRRASARSVSAAPDTSFRGWPNR